MRVALFALCGHLTKPNTPLNDAEPGGAFDFLHRQKTRRTKKQMDILPIMWYTVFRGKKQAQVEEKVCDIYQLQKWQKDGMSRNVV